MTSYSVIINKFEFPLYKRVVALNIYHTRHWWLREMTHVVSHWLRQPHLYALRVWQHM